MRAGEVQLKRVDTYILALFHDFVEGHARVVRGRLQKILLLVARNQKISEIFFMMIFRASECCPQVQIMLR